jgi:hypothetical protein
MNFIGRYALIAGTLVLLVGVGLILSQDLFRKQAVFSRPVQNLMPASSDMPGWQTQYLPIADTPELQKRVLDLLDYDDAVYVTYTKGDLRVSVYLAYWKPGKVSPRSIARHTPDVCWTLAGWDCIKRQELPTFRFGTYEGKQTEYRVFTANGRTEYVVFWHVFGDEIVSYHTGWRPPWDATITDFLRWGNQQKLEQYFLRVSSNRPLTEFRDCAPLLHIISQFSQISKPL